MACGGRFQCRTCLLVSLFFVLWLRVASGGISTLPEDQERQLEDFIESLMECRANVGLSIAMVRDGETVYAEGVGIRDDALPMESNTKISLGSLTKSFTGTLAADVVHSGSNQLTWDTPLRDVLGEDFELEGEFRTQQASFRDIYSHRLGMLEYWGVATAHLPFSREELCMDRMRHFYAIENFRNRYAYTNWPWVLGAYVTEQITGLTWKEQVVQTIFEPLGMSDTKVSSDLEGEDWDNLAYSYTEFEEGFRQNPEQDQLSFVSYICPAACIFSTAEDMAKYMKFHLSEGQNKGGEQVVPAAAMRDLISPNSYVGRQSPRIRRPVYPVDESVFTTGLGLQQGTYRGMDKIEHTGSYSSYTCRLTMLKDVSVGVWSCVNSPGDSRASTAVRLLNMYALDLLLGCQSILCQRHNVWARLTRDFQYHIVSDEEPWLNGTTACTFPAPWETSQVMHSPSKSPPPPPPLPDSAVPTNAQRPLEEYVGEYVHPGFGIFTVYLNETDSNLHYHFGLLLSGRLDPASGDDEEEEFYMHVDYPLDYRMAFYPQYPDGFPLSFGTDDDDNIASVSVPYMEFELPPVFYRI